MNLPTHISSDWTTYSQYHIDFDRGIVVHSKSTSRGQINRYFHKATLGGDLKHLTYPQLTEFYMKTETGELYFEYLKQLAVTQLGRGVIQASPSYLRNHQRVFAHPLNTMQYPVSQNTVFGYVRSLLDRQKVVDYQTTLQDQSHEFGQSRFDLDRKSRKAKVIEKLRQIAFAKPQSTA